MANLSKELANAYAIRASKRRRKRELELPDHVAMANAYIGRGDHSLYFQSSIHSNTAHQLPLIKPRDEARRE